MCFIKNIQVFNFYAEKISIHFPSNVCLTLDTTACFTVSHSCMDVSYNQDSRSVFVYLLLMKCQVYNISCIAMAHIKPWRSTISVLFPLIIFQFLLFTSLSHLGDFCCAHV